MAKRTLRHLSLLNRNNWMMGRVERGGGQRSVGRDINVVEEAEGGEGYPGDNTERAGSGWSSSPFPLSAPPPAGGGENVEFPRRRRPGTSQVDTCTNGTKQKQMKMGGSSHRRRRRRSAPEAMAESTVASSTTTSKQIISKNRRDNSKSATNTHTHKWTDGNEERRRCSVARYSFRFPVPCSCYCKQLGISFTKIFLLQNDYQNKEMNRETQRNKK